jgi:chromosome segregation protein
MVFDPGLTVVVGPNGSGKSNISDAILWVLGEQSAKMLRGAAMEDVIFSGSTARKPVGVAEVTLVLDNSDRTLPVEFDEVGVTRRMYRSGESEYLINDAPARLMDIQDILHDSGLGKDTHSIISQGKLDSILASRPEERRSLIEEAAGISKHRRRRERSERKLADMDANLVRAKDVSREINRQLRPLERQVDKAKRYNDLTDRLAELTCTLAVDDLRRLQAQWRDIEGRGKEADAAVELARYRVGEKQRDLEKLQSMLEQKGLFVGDLGEQRRRCQDILGRIDSDMRLLEEKGRNMVDRLSETRMSLSGVERQRKEGAREHESLSAELSAAKVSAAALEADVAEFGPAAEEAARDKRQADELVAQLTADLRARQRAADEATLAYSRLKDAISNAEVEDSMFANRLDQIQETADVAREALAQRKAHAAELQVALDSARGVLDGSRERIERASSEVEARRTSQDSTREELSRARASLAALRSVDAAAESSSPLMAKIASREDVSSVVECRLSDLIEVPADLEALVERLLGEDVNALVVADAHDLSSVAASALDSRDAGGRATVVARSSKPTPPASNASGRRLVDLLTVRDDAHDLLDALLGDVRLVDSLDEAVRAHEKDPASTYAIVDGATVLPDGRVVVGTTQGAEEGSLERKRRICALDSSIPKLSSAFDQATSALESADAALVTERDAAAAAKGEVSRLAGELDSCSAEVSRLEAQVSLSAAQLADVTKKREVVCAKAQEARPGLEEHSELAASAKRDAASISERIAVATEARAAAIDADASAAASLADARLKLATIQERRRHLEVRCEELSRSVSDLDRRREAMETSTRSLEVLRLRVDPLHERYVALRECAVGWAERLRDRASLAEADSASLKKTINDARAQVTSATEELDRASAESNDAKVASGKLEVQVQNAIEAITADGRHVLDDALRLPAPDDREAMEREVADLRRRVEGLGPVNQVAMDEYTRLKERGDYIDSQLADLESARQSLTKIMSAIDRKMRRQFLTTYESVNTNFQEIFSLLFPGGQAHLEMCDPDHPVETGIEVVAQPRGKRITKMTLMSGGEKSLTALALLFAVYRTRTVPFYVFDEVEAALDDSNLNKLLDAIEQLKNTTQLIVISHQRRTMEQADVLYGVSMQADGVSHVVSQRLDHSTGKVVDA